MVDVNVSNKKLLARGLRIVMQATDCSADTASAALEAAENNVKLAILTILTDMNVEAARDALKDAGGFLRATIGGEKGG